VLATLSQFGNTGNASITKTNRSIQVFCNSMDYRNRFSTSVCANNTHRSADVWMIVISQRNGRFLQLYRKVWQLFKAHWSGQATTFDIPHNAAYAMTINDHLLSFYLSQRCLSHIGSAFDLTQAAYCDTVEHNSTQMHRKKSNPVLLIKYRVEVRTRYIPRHHGK
jgi:hypothetical protein